jgi:hypothetical protein
MKDRDRDREKEINDLAFITEGLVNLKNDDPEALTKDRIQLIREFKRHYSAAKNPYVHRALVSMESAMIRSGRKRGKTPLDGAIDQLVHSKKTIDRLIGRTLLWSVKNQENQIRMEQKFAK